MKQGQINLVQLAKKIMDQKDRKIDYVVDTASGLEAVRGAAPDGNEKTRLEINDIGTFDISDVTHGQIAQWSGIPKRYYDTMLSEAQPLLRNNVNWWFQSNPKKRLIRTMEHTAPEWPDSMARAFLSDRYRILDYDEVLAAVLPTIQNLPVKVESCEVTERKMYVKMVFPETQREIKTAKVGEVVSAGFMISNSEIGLGGVMGQPFIFTLSCRNGAVINDLSFKKYHIGRQIGNGHNAEEYFKDDTRQAEDKAFLLKLRDMLTAISAPENFTKITDRLQETTGRKIESRPDKAVEVLSKKAGLNEAEHVAVLTHFIENGDLSQYGLQAAVTRASQDVADYDRCTELEILGGQIIDLNPTEWKEIACAA